MSDVMSQCETLWSPESGTLPDASGLNREELELFYQVMEYLDSHEGGQCVPPQKRLSVTRALGAALEQFPQMRRAGGRFFPDRDSLLDSLGAFGFSIRPSRLQNRITEMRNYLNAKCHIFSMLSLLVEQKDYLYRAVRRVMFSVICTLVAEDVYISCLEDAEIPLGGKYRLADRVLDLWDTAEDPHIADHLPALESLWVSRETTVPNFGSMIGASEMIRLSMNMGDDWQQFLVSHLGSGETISALEEFIFGLSWEEIGEVRARLEKFGINAVNSAELRSFLGTRPAYGVIISRDSRAIHDFYMARRERAIQRKYTLAPDGPRKTLEEMYLRYRMELPVSAD